jgi:hypothetical protein
LRLSPLYEPRQPTPNFLLLMRTRVQVGNVEKPGIHNRTRLLVTGLSRKPHGSGDSTTTRGRASRYQGRVRMTALPSHGDVPRGSFPLATWSGTLSPTGWRGDCQKRGLRGLGPDRPRDPSVLAEGEGLGHRGSTATLNSGRDRPLRSWGTRGYGNA